MRQDRVLVDIRLHRGDSRFIIELARRFSSGLAGATVEWVVRPDQAHLLPSDHIFANGDRWDANCTARIRDRLIQTAQSENPDGSLWVLSYDPAVLFEGRQLQSTGRRVTAKDLAELIREGRSPRYSPYNATPPTSNAPLTPVRLGVVEAIEIAKNALCRGNHLRPETALPQKDLRAAMAGLDDRAFKRADDPSSASLITDVVENGLQSGWLKRFRRVPEKTGTELIYLVEVAGAQARAAELMPSPASAAESALLIVEIGAQPTQPSADALDRAEPSRQRHANRATEFEATLQKARIGSLPETRCHFFDAMEAVIAGCSGDAGMMLPEFFSDVARRAQANAKDAGYTAEKNWGVAQRCIQRLTLWAGVLMGATGSIEDKIGCNSTRVVRLDPNFRRNCEGFLAMYVIRQTGGISYDDDPYYLGLLLYRKGQQKAVSAEELKAKADQLLTFLYDGGQIEMDLDRRIVAADKPKQRLSVVAG